MEVSPRDEILTAVDKNWGQNENVLKLISEVELIQNELSNEESDYGTDLKETLENGGTIGKDIISSLYLKALRIELIRLLQ